MTAHPPASAAPAQPGSPTAGTPDDAPRCVLLLLHGLTMRPEALQAFAQALAPLAAVRVPPGPVQHEDGSRSWWAVDPSKRAQRLAAGPSDLFDRHPAGRAQARASLAQAVAQARADHPGLPLMLAGFSQGGMLAIDYLLLSEAPVPVDGLALLSSTRIALDEWQPALGRLAGLPALVAHGLQDQDLSLSAGEGLRDLLQAAGAQVRWLPFEGGHELPLVVWRALRRFVAEQVART